MLFFDLFCNDPEMVTIAAGANLFREGEPSNGVMYVLITGRAKVTLNAVSLEEVHAGDILGEMGVIDHSPRSTTVVAETRCTFAKIDERRFYFLVQQTPYFGIEVMKVMAKRLRQCDLHLAEAMARTPAAPLQ